MNVPVYLRVETLALIAGLALSGIPEATAGEGEFEFDAGGTAKMAEPGDHWFMTIGFFGGGNVFDADSGEMQGKVNVSDFTSAVSLDRGRDRVYVPVSYYSRGTYGERTDLLVVNDVENLAPVAEIEVPNKLAAVFHRAVINPVGDKFIALFNMTPGQSVSIVDVENQTFVGEISTAGCGFVYPVSGNRFMQICGDGTVQVIALDDAGQETDRMRSRKFFDLEKDPVFDLAVPKSDGWLLISFEGLVYDVTVDDRIEIARPWSLLTEDDAEERWRVGGDQPFAYNDRTGILFALVHQGGPDTHEEPGTEVWAFNVPTQRRGYRVALEHESAAIDVSQDAEPLLYVSLEGSVQVHDAVTGRLRLTIPETGLLGGRVQAF